MKHETREKMYNKVYCLLYSRMFKSYSLQPLTLPSNFQPFKKSHFLNHLNLLL